MINYAYLVEAVTVIDPDTKGEVNVCIFKHQNGGMFGMDSSYIEQCFDDDEAVIINDPFDNTGDSLVELEGI